jgi:hypothetical protein
MKKLDLTATQYISKMKGFASKLVVAGRKLMMTSLRIISSVV